MKVEFATLCELSDAGPQTDQLFPGYVGGSTHQQFTVYYQTLNISIQ